MKIDMKLYGLEEVVRKIEQMPVKVAQRMERRVLKKSLEDLFNAVVSRVPVGETGNLADSVKVRVRKRGLWMRGDVVATAPHAHLVEYGHRMVTKSGAVVGFVEPSPTPRGFLRASLDEQGEGFVNDTIQNLIEELERMESKR